MVSTSKAAAIAISLFFLSDQALAWDCEQKCQNPIMRREWRTLSIDDRLEFIDAVKCVMKKPALTDKTDLPGVSSRYDDFLGTHIVRADDVHFVGVFYPYHRLLVHAYEMEVQACGWKEGLPYWDWIKDTADDESFFDSPIFDEEHGFGGNGAFVPGNWTHPEPGFAVNTPWDVPDRSGGGCIETGPFAGLQSNLGPENNTGSNPHCVRRDFSPGSLRGMSGPRAVVEGMNQSDYGFFDRVTELSFHSGGHWALGGLYGTMTDKWASPADPLFWLHHANVDRAWWSWQHRDIEARVRDISGPLVAFDFANALAGNVTLNYTMEIGETDGMKLKATVSNVMHIQRGLLCYEYDDLY